MLCDLLIRNSWLNDQNCAWLSLHLKWTGQWWCKSPRNHFWEAIQRRAAFCANDTLILVLVVPQTDELVLWLCVSLECEEMGEWSRHHQHSFPRVLVLSRDSSTWWLFLHYNAMVVAAFAFFSLYPLLHTTSSNPFLMFPKLWRPVRIWREWERKSWPSSRGDADETCRPLASPRPETLNWPPSQQQQFYNGKQLR